MIIMMAIMIMMICKSNLLPAGHDYEIEVFDAGEYDCRIQRVLSFFLFLDTFGKGWREKFTH